MRILAALLLVSPALLAAAPAETTASDTPAPGAAPTDTPAPIINGEDADTDDYPMTGGMLLDADLTVFGQEAHIRSLVCSSTLIAPDVVLLAAHCIDPDVLTYGSGTVDNSDIRWTREADLTDFDGTQSSPRWPADAVQAWDWVGHPDWDYRTAGMGLSENHDVALLFLSEPVLDVPYAWLATTDEAEQIEEGLTVEVVGWGLQEAPASQFEQPDPGTYAIKQMGESYLNEVNAYEMQIGGVATDVRKCHGDSGGPTFLSVTTDTPDSLRVIGVTSHAYDTSDCEEKGGVDTRVDHYRDWIDGELRARCADGTRSWCEQQGIPDPTLQEDPLADEGDDDEETPGGCACDMGGTGAVGGVLLQGLVLAGLVRRRRG